jgi:hypothetical protein
MIPQSKNMAGLMETNMVESDLYIDFTAADATSIHN